MYFRIRTEQYDIFMTIVNVLAQILLYKKINKKKLALQRTY